MLKKKHISLLLLLLISTSLPLAILGKSKQEFNKADELQNTVQVPGKKLERQRTVQKFKSVSQNSAQNLFSKIQAQITTSNLNIAVANKAKFNFQTQFTSYDQYSQRKKQFDLMSPKSQNSSIITVGVNQIPAMLVKISEPGQNWAKLIFDHAYTLDLTKVNPESVSYEISATGQASNASIELFRKYSLRSSPNKVVSEQFGTFDVHNFTQRIKKFLFSTQIGSIVLMISVVIATVVILSLLVFGAVVVRRFYRRFALAKARRLAFQEEADKIVENETQKTIMGYKLEQNKIKGEIEALNTEVEKSQHNIHEYSRDRALDNDGHVREWQLDSQIKDKQAELRASKNAIIEETRRREITVLTEVKEEIRSEVDNLNTSHKAEVNNLTVKHSEEEAEITSGIQSATDEIEAAESDIQDSNTNIEVAEKSISDIGTELTQERALGVTLGQEEEQITAKIRKTNESIQTQQKALDLSKSEQSMGGVVQKKTKIALKRNKDLTSLIKNAKVTIKESGVKVADVKEIIANDRKEWNAGIDSSSKGKSFSYSEAYNQFYYGGADSGDESFKKFLTGAEKKRWKESEALMIANPHSSDEEALTAVFSPTERKYVPFWERCKTMNKELYWEFRTTEKFDVQYMYKVFGGVKIGNASESYFAGV